MGVIKYLMNALNNLLKLKWLITLIVFLSLNPCYSADVTNDYLQSKPDGNSFDNKRWEKLKDDYKYKTPKIDNTKSKAPNFKKPFFSGNSAFLRLLAYIVIFLLIALVIYLLARNGFLGDKSLQKKSLNFDISNEPEDITDLEIDALLIEALKNEDYKLATRLRFLSLLQLLNQKNYIKWKRERTNKYYSQLLSGNKIQLHFKQLALIYESIWYGDYYIDENRYQSVDKLFKSAFSVINTNQYV